MFLFLNAILQIFVPYIIPNQLELPELNKTAFNTLLETNQTIIVYAVEKSYKEMIPVIRSMNEVASLYSDYPDVSFIYADRNLAQEIAYANYYSLPSFFVFMHGKLWCSFEYPKIDSAFAKIINSFFLNLTKTTKNPLDKTSVVLKTKEDVLKYVGDCYYTILALPELYENAIEILHQNYKIECDIQFVTKDLLNSLDLDDQRLALYRREDDMIISFSNFSIAKIPYYSVMNYHSIFNEARPIFGIASRNSEFLRQYEDLLYELSDKYPDFVFVFINNDYYNYINSTVGINVRKALNKPPLQSKPIKILGEDGLKTQQEETYVVEGDERELVPIVFNSYKRYTYQIDDIFTHKFLSKKFKMKRWLKASKKVLDSIRNNTREKQYISEPVPLHNPMHGIKTVVGSTYQKFINQPDKDVIIIFARLDSMNSIQYLSSVERFYNLTKKNLESIDPNFVDSNYAFGVINVVANSGDFPYIPGLPYQVMYPMKNKSKPCVFRGSISYENFLWFLNRYSSKPLPLNLDDVPPMQKVELEQTYKHMLQSVYSMPQADQEDFFSWAAEMADFIGMDPHKLPGLPEQYHHHEHHHEHDDEHEHGHKAFDDL